MDARRGQPFVIPVAGESLRLVGFGLGAGPRDEVVGSVVKVGPEDERGQQTILVDLETPSAAAERILREAAS